MTVTTVELSAVLACARRNNRRRGYVWAGHLCDDLGITLAEAEHWLDVLLASDEWGETEPAITRPETLERLRNR